jgi:hypothetical protein
VPRIIADPFSRLASATVALLGVAVIIMAASEVPASLIAASLGVISSHTVVGVWLFDRLTRSTATIVERLGVGAAVGSLLALVWDQALVTTPLRDVSWTVFPVAALAIVVNSLRQRQAPSPVRRESSSPSMVALLILALVLLVQERYWPLPVALGLVPLAFVLDRWTTLRGRSVSLVLTLAALSATVAALVTAITLRTRPPLWWIKTQDFQFFEALSFSLAHWGSGDQVFVTGYPVYYHWFSYAWTGMLRRIIEAPEWVVLTRIAPVFVVLVVVLLVIELARRAGVADKSVALVVVVFALLTDLNFESFSMVFSYVWLLGFAVLAARFLDDGLTPVSWLAPLLAAGSFGAKSSNAPLIVAVVTCVVIVAWWRDKRSWWRPLVFGVAHGVGLFVVFERLYLRSTYSEGIELGTIGIARDFFGDIEILTPTHLLIASMIVLIHFAAVHVVAVILAARSREGRTGSVTVIAVGAVLGSIPFLALTWSNDFEQEEYFLHAMSAVTSILVGTVLVRFVALRRPVRMWLIPTVALVGALWWWMTVPRTNEGTYTAVFLRIIVDTPAMWLVVLAGPAYIISRIIGRTGRLTTANWLLLLLVAATVVPLNQRWFLKYDDFNAEIREPGHEEFMLGRRDVIDGAMLVRNNTPADAIIMSNHFCERPICALADYGPHRINWKRGGEAMTLTVYSQRRFWVNGYGFLWQNVEPPVDIRRRIADSLDPRGARVAADFYLRDTSASGLIPGERIPLVRSDRFALYPR